MKCVCGSELKKIVTEVELFEGDIWVKNVEAYFCRKCKEELYTAEQVNQIRAKVSPIIPLNIFHMRKKIVKVGNSLAIPLSSEVVQFLQIEKGSEVEIDIRNKKRLIMDVG